MERPDNTALNQRPEAFDGLVWTAPYDVPPARVVNDAVVVPFLGDFAIAESRIRAKQADLIGNGLMNQGGQSGGPNVGDHARIKGS